MKTKATSIFELLLSTLGVDLIESSTIIFMHQHLFTKEEVCELELMAFGSV